MNVRSLLLSFATTFAVVSCSLPCWSQNTVPPAAKPESSKSTTPKESIGPTSAVVKIRGDFAFTEGPAWDSKQRLYFTDIPNSTIHVLGREGKVGVFTDQSNHTNGLLVAADGRLLACEMDGQVVAYDTKTGNRTVLASEYNGKRFNAPNDLVIDQDGGIYFTDPLFRAPQPLPQTVQAVYYIATSGVVTRVTGDIAAPNGIGLSADGKTLYVIPSQQAEMLAFDVQSPGKLTNQRVFCSVSQPEGRTDTGGDGMAIDVDGNLYLTTHLGVEIFSDQGQRIALVKFPEQPANVTLGGPTGKTMYVTARTGLYSVEMPRQGLKPN